MTEQERALIYDKILESELLQFRGYDDNNYLLNSLNNNQLIFSSPKQFNDPFDCNLPIDTNCTPSEIQEFYIKIQSKKGILTPNEASSCSKKLYDNPNILKNYIKDLIYDHRRFSCFTTASNEAHLTNSRFWGNYANKHNGICMKFSVEFLKDTIVNNNSRMKFIPIRYCDSDKIPEFNYIKNRLRDIPTSVSQHYLGTKSKEWEDENEIRLVYDSKDKIIEPYIYHKFNPRYLQEIYFGINLSTENKKKLKRIFNQPKYRHVELFKLEKDQKQFKLNTIRIN